MVLLTGLLCALSVLGRNLLVGAFSVTGDVGGNISIRCSHHFARRNTKFFCDASCKDQDILVRSDPLHNPSVRGRFSLFDRGTGTFVVTISQLRMNDTGRYWCGVVRGIFFTYHQVDLVVSGAPAPTYYPVPTTPEQSTSSGTEETKTTEPSPVTTGTTGTASIVSTTEHPENRKKYVTVYIGAGLAALVVLLVIFLLTLVQLKRRWLNFKLNSQRKDSVTEPFLSTNTALDPDFPAERSQDDPGPPGSSKMPDDLHYSVIDFGFMAKKPRKPAGATECVYATVKPAQSLAPIYAIVRKIKSPKTRP